VDWYYKGALIVGLLWATARVLGAYGEAARELDIGFLFGFMLTTGGWAAVFLVIDRVAKFLGWRRPAPARATAEVQADPGLDPGTDLGPASDIVTPMAPGTSRRPARSSRRPRR